MRNLNHVGTSLTQFWFAIFGELQQKKWREMKRKKGKFAVIFSTRNGNVCQLEKSFLFFPYFSFGGLQAILDFKKSKLFLTKNRSLENQKPRDSCKKLIKLKFK